MLDESLPKQSWLTGLDGEAEVGHQLPGQVAEGHLNVGAHGLALAQAMEQIVTTHADLTFTRGPVDMLNHRYLTLKKRLVLFTGCNA